MARRQAKEVLKSNESLFTSLEQQAQNGEVGGPGDFCRRVRGERLISLLCWWAKKTSKLNDRFNLSRNRKGETSMVGSD